MNVTESGFKNRQLHMEDYLQMVSEEQKEYAEVFDYSKITEKSGVITDYWTNNLLDLILRKDCIWLLCNNTSDVFVRAYKKGLRDHIS